MDKTIINELKRFVQGKMSLSDLELFQINNPEIWLWLQSLLTQDMINNPEHDFWKVCRMRLSLEANGFRVKTTATAFGFEGLGALSRIHHLISCLIITQYGAIFSMPILVKASAPNNRVIAPLLSFRTT